MLLRRVVCLHRIPAARGMCSGALGVHDREEAGIIYLGYHPFLQQHMRTHRMNRLSTQQVRTVLTGVGVPLDGKQIDHIIPKSVGGLDHPRNYCIVPDELNRAWANNWTADKRAILGHRIIRSACGFAQWTKTQAESRVPLQHAPRR
jgi:hypothetical protein